MITMAEVKEECAKNKKCETCVFHPKYEEDDLSMDCIIMDGGPSLWDLDRIKKLLRRKKDDHS